MIKKYQKLILIFLFLLSSFGPQLALASWYNPLSWGDEIADWWYRPDEESLEETADSMQTLINRQRRILNSGINPITKEPLTPEQRSKIEQSIVAIQAQIENLPEESQAAYDEAKKDLSAGTCTMDLNFSLNACILQGIAMMGNIVTGVFGGLLWVAGHIFDLSVWLSISTINGWFKGNDGIVNAWRVARDIANICFIFILLYIALGTVFEMSGIANNTQKLVVNVIIIALLVNFSGFFTRVVIDASNIVAYEFYSKLSGSEDGGASLAGIGGRFVDRLWLTSYYVDSPKNKLEEPQVEHLSFFGIIIQTFGNIILILAASFVLLAGAIMFLIRTIYLIFLYIFSPLAFVSKVIPSSKFNYFQQWIDKLVQQSFFAPGFLIPLYIVFAITDKGIATLSGNNTNTLWGTLGGGSMIIILMDFLIIGLIIGCIFVANKAGAAGAKLATSVAGASTLGGVKLLGKPFTSERTKKWAREISEQNQRANQYGAWRPNILSRAAARSINTAQTVRGAGESLSKAKIPGTNIVIGKTNVGKKITDVMKNPLLTASDKIVDLEASIRSGGGGSYSILGKTSTERADSKKKEKEQKEEEKKAEIKDKGDKLKATTSEADASAILLTMTNSEIKQLEGDVLTHSHVARSLNKSNLEAIEKEGKLTDGQKATIKTAITTTPLPNNANNQNSGYVYMTTGSGATIW